MLISNLVITKARSAYFIVVGTCGDFVANSAFSGNTSTRSDREGELSFIYGNRGLTAWAHVRITDLATTCS